MNREREIVLGKGLSQIAGGFCGGTIGIAIGNILSVSSSLPTLTGIVGTLLGLWVTGKLFDKYGIDKQKNTSA